ncbi:MAG: Lrp/AsnC family transcriptional regulator [Cellulomonas sp.]|uniref:Lrp/AsnC family transcriptional regulator n=1 Tax=Cellulomonas sp. TaxID=40001 RepID=UPI00183DBECA|nr:Lrp/AsnC family transcriptional regulator [Cellulomonas sp.]NMM17562.1 Lrp/AsnC family transcriptional regulator [Cellulomonas sp.]NMM30516.1 Lrp/AsnC family transcriptional regulator [Cellulomonas sp.]
MAEQSSPPPADRRDAPNDLRADRGCRLPLDDVDRRLLALLERDGRMANNALAEAVGIAPSTCLARVRLLRESGVIRGFHADIDPAALGRGLRAMVAVRMQPGSRQQLAAFARHIAARPEILDVYFLAGADDFLVHVAVRDTEALRAFVVDQLSARPEVAVTQTSLIFEHMTPGGSTRG